MIYNDLFFMLTFYNDLFSILTYKWFGPAKKILFCAFCKIFATFLQFFAIFCNFFANFWQFVSIFLQIFFSNFLHIFQKKKRNRGHESIIQQPLLEKRISTWKWVPFVLIPNQFAKNLQKICKRFAKKLVKICKNFAKSCCKKICKIADFLQARRFEVSLFRRSQASASFDVPIIILNRTATKKTLI